MRPTVNIEDVVFTYALGKVHYWDNYGELNHQVIHKVEVVVTGDYLGQGELGMQESKDTAVVFLDGDEVADDFIAMEDMVTDAIKDQVLNWGVEVLGAEQIGDPTSEYVYAISEQPVTTISRLDSLKKGLCTQFSKILEKQNKEGALVRKSLDTEL